MERVRYKQVGDGYEAIGDCTYTSPRYGQRVTVRNGFYSDGATFAIDIDSDSWWFHDVLCRYGKWDDGTPCTNWQASSVLHDIMRRDGYPLRAPFWRLGTWLLGGGAARMGKIF